MARELGDVQIRHNGGVGLLERWDASNQRAVDGERATERFQMRVYTARPWQFAVWIVLVMLYVAVSPWFAVPGFLFLVCCAIDSLRRGGRPLFTSPSVSEQTSVRGDTARHEDPPER